MHSNSKTRQCLICFEEIAKTPSFYHFCHHSTLCFNCLNQFEIYNQTHLFNGYPLTILYYYNDFFKQLLFQYKGQDDYALKDAFLNPFYHFKTKYRRHIIVTVPSSDQDNLRRGFNPNEMIVTSFSNNIFTGLYKTSNYKQTSQTNRKLVKDVIKIKDGNRLFNQDVIIFDDVITSGNTIMTCANLIASFHPRSLAIVVMASNQIDHLITSKYHTRTRFFH